MLKYFDYAIQQNKNALDRVTSVRENQGILKCRFQIRENLPFWRKSGNFIMNQGENQGISACIFLFLKKFARALGARIM